MKKKITSVLLMVMTAFFAVFPRGVSAFAESPSRIVKIGYYSGDDRFEAGFSNGARKSGYAYEYYQSLSTLTGWEYEYVYGTREEIIEKMLNGEVDMTAGVYKTEKRQKQFLFSYDDMGLAGEPRYFVVRKDRADLLKELNEAQAALLNSRPDYEIALLREYYAETLQSSVLTAEEREWLAQKGEIHFGYLRGNLPISDIDENGEPTGVVKYLVSALEDYLKIPVKPICYDNAEKMLSALSAGEADVAFPAYSDMWLMENMGFNQTDTIVTDRLMIVYKGEYRGTLTNRIAIDESGMSVDFYVSEAYPKSEYVRCKSLGEALQAVRDNKADCIIGSASKLRKFLTEHTEFSDFNTALTGAAEGFGFAIKRGKSPLLDILNKAAAEFDKTQISGGMIQYSNVQKGFTFNDFISKYGFFVILTLLIFFAVLAALFLSFRRRTLVYNAEQAKMRRELKEALDHAQEASRAKSTFLSGISHDIRTPMNGIIGMTVIAEANIDDKEHVKDCLDKITASGKHLLSLINDVLDMSKIESGEIALHEEKFSLSDVMDDLININMPQIEARGHELLVHLGDLVHEKVIGDRLRVQQIFTNILGNAVKYTPNGGRIEIHLSELPSDNEEMYAFGFSVKDNGIGISEEYIPYIFDAFTREENSVHNLAQGTGLGMAITKDIVHMMQGDITVESELGKGSEFTVRFCLKRCYEEERVVIYDDFKNLEVLIVCSHRNDCEEVCRRLKNLGFSAEFALSGKEAKELIKLRRDTKKEYFAAFIDMKLSDMTGEQLADEIIKIAGNRSTKPVVATYGWSEADQSKPYVYMGKPLFTSRIVAVCESLLGKKASGGESVADELSAGDFSGKRALLAEDTDLNAEIVIEITGMMGLEVDWAHDGAEAVEMLKKSEVGHYDCIFMDVQMPVMNGLEAARAIRALPRPDAITIPIFAMTANAFSEDVAAALEAGMDRHIAKPLDLNELISTLNEYLK